MSDQSVGGIYTDVSPIYFLRCTWGLMNCDVSCRLKYGSLLHSHIWASSLFCLKVAVMSCLLGSLWNRRRSQQRSRGDCGLHRVRTVSGFCRSEGCNSVFTLWNTQELWRRSECSRFSRARSAPGLCLLQLESITTGARWQKERIPLELALHVVSLCWLVFVFWFVPSLSCLLSSLTVFSCSAVEEGVDGDWPACWRARSSLWITLSMYIYLVGELSLARWLHLLISGSHETFTMFSVAFYPWPFISQF